MVDDTRNRTDDRHREHGNSDRLPRRGGGVSLQGVTSGIPTSREGQRAFSDYARAVARETLREATRTPSERASDANRDTVPPGGRVPLFDATEDEPDTAISRALASSNTARLVDEFRAAMHEEEEKTEPDAPPLVAESEPPKGETT